MKLYDFIMVVIYGMWIYDCRLLPQSGLGGLSFDEGQFSVFGYGFPTLIFMFLFSLYNSLFVYVF